MPAEGERNPGKVTPPSLRIQPTDASMATRACLSSAARYHNRVFSDPMDASPIGSHTPPVSTSLPTMSLTAAARVAGLPIDAPGANAMHAPSSASASTSFIILVGRGRGERTAADSGR